MNCLWPPTAEKLNLSEAKSVMLDKIKDSTSSTRYYIIPDTNCLHKLEVQHTSPLCSSSLCLAIFYITSFQWLAQASTAVFGSARSSPVHCGAWRHLIMCSIVCSCPHSQVSDDVSFHFFMDAGIFLHQLAAGSGFSRQPKVHRAR